MSGGILKRHAVGTAFRLGTLYDARSDVFHHQSAFDHQPPDGAVEITASQTTTSIIKTPKNFQERCDLVDVGPELGASILSGLCNVPDDWERFLVDQIEGPVLRHTITTRKVELNLMAKGVKEALSTGIDANAASHALTGVVWGADFIIRAKHVDGGPEGESRRSESAIAALMHLANSLSTADSLDEHAEFQDFDLPARDAFFRVSANFRKNIGGRGRPIAYTLMPVSRLSFLRLADITGDCTFPQPMGSVLASFFYAFDELFTTYQEVRDYLDRCQHCTAALPKGHLAVVTARHDLVLQSRRDLRNRFADALMRVRLDRGQGDPLQSLLDIYQASEFSASAHKRALLYSDKLDFVETILHHKAVYLGRGGPPLHAVLQDNSDKDVFVLHYSDIRNKARPEEWIETRNLLDEILWDSDPTKIVVVKDCDVAGKDCEPAGRDLNKSYIAHFRQGRLYVNDVLEHQRMIPWYRLYDAMS